LAAKYNGCKIGQLAARGHTASLIWICCCYKAKNKFHFQTP